MAYDLTEPLVIGISSRALFNLEDENKVFETQGLKAYADYQHAHEMEILAPGPAFPLVKAFLNLNLLREEQVIHWYRNREPADAFQKRINALVVAGEVEKALRLYTKKVAQGQRRQDIHNVWECIKNNLRMLRNKLVGK